MADPVTAVIAAVKAVVTSFVAAYKASAIIRAVVAIVAVISIAAISQALIGQATPKNNQGQELALKLDPTMPRQIALGRTATGGSLLFSKTFTEDPAVPSGKLVRVIALSDRPTNLVKITEGSSDITFKGGVLPYETIAFSEVDQHRSTPENGSLPRMYVYFIPGSDDPFSDPIAANALSWLRDNCGWVGTDQGVGMCWAIVAYNYDPDAFPQGEPSLVWHLTGVQVADARRPYNIYEEPWFPAELSGDPASSVPAFQPSSDAGWDTEAGQRVWVSGRKLLWLAWVNTNAASIAAGEADGSSYNARNSEYATPSDFAYSLQVGQTVINPGDDMYPFQWLSQRVLELDMDTHVVTMYDPFDPTNLWTGDTRLCLCNDWGWAQQQTIDQRTGDLIIAGDVLDTGSIGGQVVYVLRRADGYKLHMQMWDPIMFIGSSLIPSGGGLLWIEHVGKKWTVVSAQYAFGVVAGHSQPDLQLLATQDTAADLAAKQKQTYRFFSFPFGYDGTLSSPTGVYYFCIIGDYLYCSMVQLVSGQDYRLRLWKIALATDPETASVFSTPDADGGWTDITPFTQAAGPVGWTGKPGGDRETNWFIEPAPDNTNLMLILTTANSNGDRVPPYSFHIQTHITWVSNDGLTWSDFIFIDEYMKEDWTIGTSGDHRYHQNVGVQRQNATTPFDTFKGSNSTYDKSSPELRYFRTMVIDTMGIDDFVISAWHLTYGAAPVLVGFWPSSLWDAGADWPEAQHPTDHNTWYVLNTNITSGANFFSATFPNSLYYDPIKDEAWETAPPGAGNYGPFTFMAYDPSYMLTIDPSWSPFRNQYNITSGYPWARLSFSGASNADDGAPTENIAILTHALLKGFYTFDTLIIGAQATDNDFTASNLLTAYNICDELITLAATDTRGRTQEPRYSGGIMVSSSEPIESPLKALQLAMDGQIYDCGGKINIFPGKAKTPILDLTDEDIIWSEEQSWQPYAELTSLWNGVTGSYVPEDQNFQQATFPSQFNAAYQVDDGGQRIAMNLDYAAVHSNEGIQRITKRVLEAGRFQGLVGFVGPLWAWELEQGDWFTLTSIKWGFTTKVFEVKAITFAKDLKVVIVGQEVSATVDTWDTSMVQDLSALAGADRWGSYPMTMTEAITGIYNQAWGTDTYKVRDAVSPDTSSPQYDFFKNFGDTTITTGMINKANYAGADNRFGALWDFVLPKNIRRSQDIWLEFASIQAIGSGGARLDEQLLGRGVYAYAVRVNNKSIGEVIGNPDADSNLPYDIYACEVLTPFKREMRYFRDDSDGQTIRLRIPTNAGIRWDPTTATFGPAPELLGNDHISVAFQVMYDIREDTGLPSPGWWTRGISGVDFYKGNVPFDVSYAGAVETGIAIVGPTSVTKLTAPQVITFDTHQQAGVGMQPVSTTGGLLASSGADNSVHWYYQMDAAWPVDTDVWAKVLCFLDGDGTPNNTGGFNKVKLTVQNVQTGATYVGVAVDSDDLSDKLQHEVLFNVPHTPTTGSGNIAAGDWLAFIIEIPVQVSPGTGLLQPFIYRAHAQTLPPTFPTSGQNDVEAFLMVDKVNVLVPLVGPGGSDHDAPTDAVGLDTQPTCATAIAASKVICYSGNEAKYPDRTVAAEEWTLLGITTAAAVSGAAWPTYENNGFVTDATWTWTIGDPVFVGDTGDLTQTRPVTGWVHVIGVASAATTIRLAGVPY